MPKVTLTYDCPAEAGDLHEAIYADELAGVLRDIWYAVKARLDCDELSDRERQLLAEIRELITESHLEGY